MGEFKVGDRVTNVVGNASVRGLTGTVKSVGSVILVVAYDAGGEQPTCYDHLVHTVTPLPTEPRGVGLKFDAGKVQARLLREGVPRALEELDKVLTFGAKKYAAHSWQDVENGDERYQDASYRHDSARNKGELFDRETGLLHRTHHIINEMFLLELELRREGLDAVKKA